MKKFNELWEKLLDNPTKFDFVLTCNSGRGMYRKVPKFSDARKLCCNLPKIQTKRPNLRIFLSKRCK